MPQTSGAHLPALTGLRAVLALWVVVHHLTGRGMLLDAWVGTMPYLVHGVIRRGFLAVGTFFVLSGFVLARNYASTQWNRGKLWRYGVSRFARIYPVYLLSLLVVSPFIINAPLPLTGGPLLSNKAGLLADHGLLLLGWTGTLPVNWNTPAWSLSCEVFFYLCFPAAIVFLSNIGPRRAALLAAVVWVLPSALLAWGLPANWKPLIHLADFVTGIVTARVFELLLRSRWTLTGRGYWFYLPGFAALIVVAAYPGLLPGAVDINSAMLPWNAAILLGLAFGGGLPAGALSSGVAVYLGKASYSMYILHVPLLWWWRRLWPRLLSPVSTTAQGLAYLAAVIAISALVFQFFEEPVGSHLRRRLCRR